MRNAANTIPQKKSGYLVSFFKKKAYQKGRGAAITATARKLAVIIWNMLSHKKEYLPIDMKAHKQKAKIKLLQAIANKMKRMDITLEEIVNYKPLALKRQHFS